MSSVELYWVSKTVVIEWALTKLDGTPADDATVSGTVTKPDLSTTAMSVAWDATKLVWRLTYDPGDAGRHAYRIEATGTADSAEEGYFIVQSSLIGAPPVTLDPATSIGRVRLLIADTNEASPVFTDAQMQAFVDLRGGVVQLAAATALRSVAGNAVMVRGKLKMLDVSTDAPAEAKALSALADKYEAEVDAAGGTEVVGGTDPTSVGETFVIL